MANSISVTIATPLICLTKEEIILKNIHVHTEKYFKGWSGKMCVNFRKICIFFIAVISPLATEDLSIRLPLDARLTFTFDPLRSWNIF